jgi:hypothetical protein
MRSIRTALAASALAAVVALAGCKADEPAPSTAAGPPARPGGGAPATTAAGPTTSTTGGSAGARRQDRPGAAEAVTTARDFMRREVGMTTPIAGRFRPTGADTGQVDMRPGSREGGGPWRDGPVTVVSLKRLRAVWYILGARTRNIQVSAPAAAQVVASPVHVAGRALAFEGTVQVRVTQDRHGKDVLLGSGFVTGGGDVLRPYDGRIAFQVPSAATGSIVLSELSAADGQGVLAATVVRVRFAT